MRSQQQATRIYVAHVAGLTTMLERLNTPVENDFFIDPAKADWSHVKTIEHLTITIKGICDMTFSEGKYTHH